MRRTYIEIFKLLTVFVLGILFHAWMTWYWTTINNDCIFSSDTSHNEDTEEASTNLILKDPQWPKSMYDVLRYELTSSKSVYDVFANGPRIGMLQDHKRDFSDILKQINLQLYSRPGNKWRVSKLIDGYRRVDPLRGEEYHMTILMQSTGNQKSKPILRMFDVIKPFGSAHILKSKGIDEKTLINFILPISNVTEKFKRFIANYEDTFLKNVANVYLLIILFIGKTKQDALFAAEVRNQVTSLKQKYRLSKIRIIQTQKPFSRALGLDLGTKQLGIDSLLFFCDVDVELTQDFARRCRNNAVKGQQVYYPVVFAQYDPTFVTRYSPPGKVPKGLREIQQLTGHWVTYGYGMACMYNQDYRRVGGFNMSITGWGGEDVDLYKKHTLSELKVFRAMDPGILHIYHNKSCSSDLTDIQYQMCIGSMSLSLASQSQLTMKMFEKKTNSTPAR